MSYTDYSQAFQGAEQKYGLPPGTLGGIGYVESRYNPQAVSPAGAKGLMQFMPATAKNLGLSNPFDPSASIDAAGNLMHQNMQATHGNLPNALMMYNAGTNPGKWQQSYADQVQSHMQPPGGQPQMPPQGNPYQRGMPTPMAPVTSLGGMAQPMQGTPQPGGDVGPNLQAFAQSQMQGGIPTKQPNKFTIGNILGTLGDAMSAYGGKQPTFGPFLREQQMVDKQQGFEMQKFNQELQMRMLAMMNPPDIMESKVFQSLPPPQQRAFLQYKDAVSPQYTMTAQGQVLNHRVTTPPSPAVAELRQAVANGDHAAVQEFDQTFGPGASAEALGAQ